MSVVFLRKALTAIILFTTCDVYADPVDDFVKALMDKHHIPGLSLAIVRNGKVIMAEGYGLASIELQLPATPSTVYQLASITKCFTATAIMLLHEDGKVDLNEKVCTYLDGVPPLWSSVTIRHLLANTSGIKDHLNDNLVDRSHSYTAEELIATVSEEPLRFLPGEDESYSNTNYVLLGMVIEKVTGKPYFEFMNERIFEPLGMTATQHHSVYDTISNSATPYEWINNKLTNARHLNPTVYDNADGGLVSTVSDLVKWNAAFKENGLYHRFSNLMWAPEKLANGLYSNYGLGWEINDVRGCYYVGHSGGRAGTSTILVHFPEHNLTIIVLANLSGVNLKKELIEDLACHYIPSMVPLHMLKERSGEEDAQTAKLITDFLRDVEKGNIKSVAVTPANRKMVERPMPSPSKSQLVFLGCQNTDQLYRKGTAIRKVCMYRINSEKNTKYVAFYITSKNQIADLHQYTIDNR